MAPFAPHGKTTSIHKKNHQLFLKTKIERAKTKFQIFWSKTIFFRIKIFLHKPFTKNLLFFPIQLHSSRTSLRSWLPTHLGRTGSTHAPDVRGGLRLYHGAGHTIGLGRRPLAFSHRCESLPIVCCQWLNPIVCCQ